MTENVPEPLPAMANFLRLQEQTKRIISPSALANIRRLHDQTEGFARSPVFGHIQQTVDLMQQSFRPPTGIFETAGLTSSVVTSSSLGSALAQQQGILSSALTHSYPILSFGERLRQQVRTTIWTADLTTSAFARSAVAAASRLSYVDKVRLRNALAHWSGLTETMQRDQLALVFARQQISTWKVDGSRKMRLVASILERSLARAVLGAIASALRRSIVLFVAAVGPSSTRPRLIDRVRESLRHLKCTISHHGPPLLPA
jgi:hypothetical protein